MKTEAKSMTFGTAYYPDHWPEAEWDRDLGRIRNAGISIIRFGEFSWSWYEPKCGAFDFAAFDRFIGLAEKHNLQLVLCTPTATPPPWFDIAFPDGRMQNAHGQRCLSARHFWCWNHAASRVQAEKTIRTLASHFAGCPTLWGWQIDNEPNYAEEVHLTQPAAMYDFQPAARAAFCTWLQSKYESLEKLNCAWRTNFWSQRFSTWEEVAFYRGKTNPHAWLDFMRWREVNIASFVHWQSDILREITPGVRIGTNIPETGALLSVAIGQDYFAQARGLDWIGTDLYAATGNRSEDLARIACSTDLMRSVSGAAEFVIAEFQGGPHERAWPNSFAGETWSPDYLTQAADIFGAHGAEQVWWFLWRPTHGGTEIGMNGVTEMDGSDSPRTATVRSMANRAPSFAKSRAEWLTRPLANIHYSRDSLLYRSFWPDDFQALEDNMVGWHSLLEALGYRVDFLNDEALLQTQTEAALLVCPFTCITSNELIDKIANSHQPIIIGPHTAFCDNNGQLRATRFPEKLQTRFGVNMGPWHDMGTLPSSPELPVIPGYRQLSALENVTVIGRFNDQQPWLTARGNAILTGIDLGLIWWRANTMQREYLSAILSTPCALHCFAEAPKEK